MLQDCQLHYKENTCRPHLSWTKLNNKETLLVLNVVFYHSNYKTQVYFTLFVISILVRRQQRLLWIHFVCCGITSFTIKETHEAQMYVKQSATITRSNKHYFLCFITLIKKRANSLYIFHKQDPCMDTKTKHWNHFVCWGITSFIFKEILVQMKAEQSVTITRSNKYYFLCSIIQN